MSTILGLDLDGPPSYGPRSGTPVEGRNQECVDIGDLFLAPTARSAAALDPGATADLVCFCRIGNDNRPLEHDGLRGVSVYQSKARLRFGDGRVGAGRHVADVPVGIAGNTGKFAAFVLGADSPAL